MPIISLALAFSALAASGSDPAAATTPVVETAVMPAPKSVEEYVREQFKDAPVMIDIARCESRFRQFDTSGKVLKNPTSSATGVFQIMASLHADGAKKNLGHDIYSLEGNAAYARHLYDKQGTAPWNASKACWSRSGHLASANKSVD